MLPIRDHTPLTKTPFINYFLIVVNVAVFIYMSVLTESELNIFVARYALIPSLVTEGGNLHTLLTSMFLHGSFGHLFGNMLFLHIFGDNLEGRLGHLGYLLFYITTGLGATAAQVLLNTDSVIPNLGASGAIAGIMGGYLVLFPTNPIDVLVFLGFFIRLIRLPAYTMLIYWFFIQLLLGIGSIGIDRGGIAYGAHVGGFVTGTLLILLLRVSKVLEPANKTIS